MSAVENVQPLQLAMFYRAGDLADPQKFSHYETEYGATLRGGNIPVSFSGLQAAKIEEAKTGHQSQSRRRIRGYDGEVLKEGPTLYESIRDEGVKNPVEVLPPVPPHSPLPMVGDGHHRVFVSAAIDKSREIPVSWVE